jgi:hypothetical protein
VQAGQARQADPECFYGCLQSRHGTLLCQAGGRLEGESFRFDDAPPVPGDEYALGGGRGAGLEGRLEAPEWTVPGRQIVPVITKNEVRFYKSGEQVFLY